MGKAVGLWYHYAFMLDTMFGAARGASKSVADGHAAPFGTEYVAILEDDLSVSVDIDAYVSASVELHARSNNLQIHYID